VIAIRAKSSRWINFVRASDHGSSFLVNGSCLQ
jgi:hypothetical protein